jgi:hypothetical protein
MKKQFIRFAVLLTVCALAVVTGVQAQKGKNKADPGKATAVVAKTGNSGQCKAPRPPNRGCKIACKPCFVPVCEGGKWVFEKLETPKEECRPAPRDERVCTIGATEFCPPSCKTCIRQ